MGKALQFLSTYSCSKVDVGHNNPTTIKPKPEHMYSKIGIIVWLVTSLTHMTLAHLIVNLALGNI